MTLFAPFRNSRTGRYLSGLALATALAFAAFKLWGQGHPESGEMKQHLAAIRVVSFISIAWLVAQLVRIGWIGALAWALPHVVRVGRHGLICFVSGTGLSIAAVLGIRRRRSRAQTSSTLDLPTTEPERIELQKFRDAREVMQLRHRDAATPEQHLVLADAKAPGKFCRTDARYV
jgi:hypothetical protein